jgi:hypothetical protein
LIACPCNPNLRTNADQAACDTVFDTTHPGYAFYHETFCMSEDVFKSSQCPCGEIDSQNLSPQQTKACDYVKAHPDSMTLYKATCRVEQALTAN